MSERLFTGGKIEKFHVGNEVGFGGFSRVYETHTGDPETKRAMKILQPREDRLHMDLFNTERDMLTVFHNAPNIVSLEASGIHTVDGEQYPYLVMDLARYGSLSHYLSKFGELPLAETIRFLPQGAAAIMSVHGEGMVHQDIKPGNFLVMSDNSFDNNLTYKLSDFDSTGYPRVEKDSIIGSAAYMPPEKLFHGEVTQRGDIYSYGVTVYRLLAGRKPYGSAELFEDFSVIHGEQRQPAYGQHLDQSEFPDDMNLVREVLLGEVMQTALSRTPADRPTNVGDFSQNLIDLYVQSEPEYAKHKTVIDLKKNVEQKPLLTVVPDVKTDVSEQKEQESLSERVAPSIDLPEVRVQKRRGRRLVAFGLAASLAIGGLAAKVGMDVFTGPDKNQISGEVLHPETKKESTPPNNNHSVEPFPSPAKEIVASPTQSFVAESPADFLPKKHETRVVYLGENNQTEKSSASPEGTASASASNSEKPKPSATATETETAEPTPSTTPEPSESAAPSPTMEASPSPTLTSSGDSVIVASQ